jgi:UPF0755 protein
MGAMRKRFWMPLAVAAAGTVLAALVGAYAWERLNAPLRVPADGARFEVPAGTPLRRVSEELAARGWLTHPRLLTWYARATGDATRIRAGEYELLPGTTPRSLLAKLVAGDVYLHQLTVVEGWRFVDLLAAIRAHPAVEAGTLDGAGIMAALGEPGVHPEGQFFPDTYRFPGGTPDIEILRAAHQALTERLDRAWRERSPDVELRSAYEALILASIIEKETALASERGLISGVFHQRLRRNMRLQTDPTVIYGLGETFDGNLRREDLVRDTPYNTYTRDGLPPTPIALPGGAAIEAAVAPEVTNAVYFVATGLADGSHSFSATLEEHERAVREYLSRLRNPAGEQ